MPEAFGWRRSGIQLSAARIIMRSAVLALVLCLSTVSGLGLSDPSTSAPLLVWGDKPFLASSASGKSLVSYEVLNDVGAVASELVLRALGKVESASFPSDDVFNWDTFENIAVDNFIIFVGKQLDASDLRKASKEPAISTLEALVESAASSVLMPYARSMGSPLLPAITELLKKHGVEVKTTGCTTAASELEMNVKEFLDAESSEKKVLLVCSSESQEKSSDALQAEMNEIASIQKAASAAHRSYMILYTSECKSKEVHAHERRLASVSYDGFGKYNKAEGCDELCITQVRWLEGILAALMLALATGAGLTCLYVLDTPTRFEAPKENR